MAETISKGKLKQKVSGGTIVLHPETDADVVKYSSTATGWTDKADVKSVLDKIISDGTGVESINSEKGAITLAGGGGNSVSKSGKTITITGVTKTDTYSGTDGTNAVTGKAVKSAIDALDVTGASGIGAGKTISAWSETDGKVSISTQDISIAQSQVSGLTDVLNNFALSSTTVNGNELIGDIVINGTQIPATSSAGSAKLVDSGGKITLSLLPDAILGQLVYGGTCNIDTATTLFVSNNAKTIIETKTGKTLSAFAGVTQVTANNAATDTVSGSNITGLGYTNTEGVFFIVNTVTSGKDFASLGLKSGDWLISTGSAWKKIDNTDAVTGVKGNDETDYRIGNINITKENIGLGNVENKTITVTSSSVSDGTNTFNKYVLSDVDIKSKITYVSSVTYDSSTHEIKAATKGGTAATVVDLDNFASIDTSTGSISIGGTSINVVKQEELGGFVTGPTSATNNELAVFDGTSGEDIKGGTGITATSGKLSGLNEVATSSSSFKITANSKSVSISTSGLTDARTLTAPNANGTIALQSSTTGTYSVVSVANGIVTSGGQLFEVIENGATPSVVVGGLFFEKNA